MATIVKKLNFKRKKGMLYFINSDGNLAEVKPKSSHKIVVAKTSIGKKRGYLYFLDKQGNIAKVKMKNYKG